MKTYLFIGTGEHRPPRLGEYFEMDGGICLAIHDHATMSNPILTRHEIEIPEGVEGLSISAWDKSYKKRPEPCLYNVPIPRPKKKVKKTVFLVVNQHDGRIVYSVHDKGSFPLMENSYPIEIEVEE